MFKPIKAVLIIGIICQAWAVSAEEPDWTAYQAVLDHVMPGVKNGVRVALVDYPAIIENGSLDKAYRSLSSFQTGNLSGTREKLAFYINAYNILALKMVADHWPAKSIKDAGSLFSPVWDKPAGKLGGKTVSLGKVEHQILRTLGEPRIHLAIVCASVSCPDLRSEPYRASTLDNQLDDQTRRFLDNPGKGLRTDGEIVRVSKIFDWFEEDFAPQGGVGAFISRYKAGLKGNSIKADLPYDWMVNG